MGSLIFVAAMDLDTLCTCIQTCFHQSYINYSVAAIISVPLISVLYVYRSEFRTHLMVVMLILFSVLLKSIIVCDLQL